MVETYEKIAFVWNGSDSPVSAPDRLGYQPAHSVDFAILANLMARVMDNSLDRSDRKMVGELGALRAARTFLQEVDESFDYDRAWWRLAYDLDGQLVGFILPVLFRGAEKGGLAEGTFYYLGVAPEHRGHGYGHDLLRQGTAVLQGVGVWRIYADTDVLNSPMIRAFEAAGYRAFGPPRRVPL